MADLVKVVALFIQDGKLLVGRNINRDLFYGIGGKREQGESNLECLIREVEEEIGCKVTKHTYFNTFVGPNFDKTFIIEMPCYLVELEGEPTPNNEVVELRWVSAQTYKTEPLASMLMDSICPALVAKGLLT